MTRQLNLRVSDAFAKRLERVAQRTGQSMASVLEMVGTPALDAAEADARFEDEAFKAWEDYQLSGAAVRMDELEAQFVAARVRAKSAAKRQTR